MADAAARVRAAHPVLPAAAGAAAAIATALLSLFAFDRRTPMAETSPATVSPAYVSPGGSITITRPVHWVRSDCDVEVSAEIVDSNKEVHRLEPFAVGRPMDLDATIVRSYPLSYGADGWLGPAQYKAVMAYQCFPFYGLWPIVQQTQALAFTVVPAGGG